MRIYLEPLKLALIIFPLLTSFLISPYVFYQYRKRGSVNFFRTIVIFAFIYYLINAYFLVILPLPDRSTVTNNYRDMMQLEPFMFVKDFINHSVFRFGDRSTYKAALLQPVFTQAVFNVMLTFPFGVFLRYYFKASFMQTVLASFCLSLFFEISQLSGLFFIYPGPYRLFDVDDLFLNTLGGSIGYVFAPLMQLFFPSRDSIDRRTFREAQRVSLFKRIFIYVLDMIVINIICFPLELVFNNHQNLIKAVVFVLYFTLFVYFRDGQTPASQLIRVKVESTKEEMTIMQALFRSLFMLVFIANYKPIIQYTLDLVVLAESQTVAIVYIVILIATLIFTAIYFLVLIVKKSSHLFYDTLTNTRMVSTFKEVQDENH